METNWYDLATKILENIPADIAIFDQKHIYQYVNRIGISDAARRNSIIGRDDFEYFEITGRSSEKPILRREKFNLALSTKQEVTWEEEIAVPEYKVILRKFYPVLAASGEVEYVIGYGVDITKIKQAENEKTRIIEELTYTNNQLNDLVSVISHNIRGPLVSLQSLVHIIGEADNDEDVMDLIKEMPKPLSALVETFDELVTAINHMKNPENVIDVLRFEDYLEFAIREFRRDLVAHNIEITYDFSECQEVKYAAKYMHTIFHNLLGNAIKYRSPHRAGKINVRTTLLDNRTVMYFSDNGMGIDLHKHGNHIFKMGKVFHRDNYGKGFGLYMTKAQIESVGGKIEVNSEVDLGTTFIVTF